MIQNSKNTNTGNLSNISGGVHIGDNIYKSLEYAELLTELESLKSNFAKAQKKSQQYPEDNDFKEDMINIYEKRKLQDKKIEAFINEIRKLNEEINRFPINTERLRIVQEYINAGEYTKARAVFDAELEAMKVEGNALLSERDYLKAKISKNAVLLNDKANEYLAYARLTIIDFKLPDRFERANTYFQESLKFERNLINLFAYAEFLDEHRQINYAILLYEELESIFRTIIQGRKDFLIPKFADVLNNLGGLKLIKNEFEPAFKYFEEAKIIQKQLVEIGQEIYKPSLALSTNNLAHLFEEQEKFDKSLELYDESILIKRQIAESDNNTFSQAAVANSLNDKAICMAKKVDKEGLGNLDEAQQLFEEALAIQRKLHAAKPDSFLPEIATTLSNLSNVYSNQKKFDLSEIMAFEGLEIRKKLYQINSQTYASDFAKSLAIAGLRVMRKEKYEEAEKYLKESLHIFQDLEQMNSKAYSINIVETAANLSSLYFNELQNKEKSLEYAHQALVNAIDLLNNFSPRAQSISMSLLEIVQRCNEDPIKFFENCINEHNRLEKS